MDFIQKIKIVLSHPLPGLEIQLQMMNRTMGKIRKEASLHMGNQVKKAAVFLLLYKREDKWHTVFMQRPESPYPHSKQISFPGGQFEETDQHLLHTARRETYEEFGIPESDIQTVGQLSGLYIPVSNFWVQPYVGYIPSVPIFQIDPVEVDALIEVPLSTLLNPQTRTTRDIATHQGYVLKDMPCFVVYEKVIWGATAMILHEFLHILNKEGINDLSSL